LPRIGKISIARHSRSCASLQSASCCENSAIPHDVSGQTLSDAGTVYTTFHVVSGWGTLDVKAGALVPTDFSRATVAAPSDTKGPHIAGPGWTLDLAPGWTVVPAAKSGSYTVKQE
jgi:hypothetical protein